MNPFTDNGTIFEHQLDYWTPEHQNPTFPRLTTPTMPILITGR